MVLVHFEHDVGASALSLAARVSRLRVARSISICPVGGAVVVLVLSSLRVLVPSSRTGGLVDIDRQQHGTSWWMWALHMAHCGPTRAGGSGATPAPGCLVSAVSPRRG